MPSGWRRASAMLFMGVAAAFGLSLMMVNVGAEEARSIPPPAVEESAQPKAASAKIVLAGGCFWGVQGVFQHVKGVTSAVSGYAGGAKETASYERVGTSKTGHAEAVEVTFDPRQISLGKILQIYFSVAHDPTTLNRQGPDRGPQYRSAIFPANETQSKIAETYIADLDRAHAFPSPIVTKIEPGRQFFPAEGYHQDFLAENPTHRYIVINDLPKIAALKRLFPNDYRATPVLVNAGHSTN